MRRIYISILLLITCFSSVASSTELWIESLTRDMKELDLFDPSSGEFVQEVPISDLAFPIAIIEDLGGDYLIEINGLFFKVGSSAVVTNHVPETNINAAETCNTSIGRSPTASSRGLVINGCR